MEGGVLVCSMDDMWAWSVGEKDGVVQHHKRPK